MAEAQRSRASVDLPSDIATTEKVLASEGTAFTAAESRELERRGGDVDVAVFQRYGHDHRDEFGGLWFDQAAGGVLVLAFTENLAGHEAALDKLVPTVEARVVRVDHSEGALEGERRRAVRVLDALGVTEYGIGTLIMVNRVGIHLGYVDPEVIEALAQRVDQTMVCVEGSEVAPDRGPQQSAGVGWRLLAFERVGEPYTVRVASTQPELRRLWDQVGFSAELPIVPLDDELVVVMTPAVSGSCPEVRFDDLQIGKHRVIGLFSSPVAHAECSADANPASFALAVERSALPDQFVVRMRGEDVGIGTAHGSASVDLAR